MKTLSIAFFLASTTVLAQGPFTFRAPITDPRFDKALQNALRDPRFDKALQNALREAPTSLNIQPQLFAGVPTIDNCAIPLRVIPVNPNLDSEMIWTPNDPSGPSMPVVKGLPPCSTPPASMPNLFTPPVR